jgi:hypothetical protein
LKYFEACVSLHERHKVILFGGGPKAQPSPSLQDTQYNFSARFCPVDWTFSISSPLDMSVDKEVFGEVVDASYVMDLRSKLFIHVLVFDSQ